METKLEGNGQRKETPSNQYWRTETLLESFITACALPRYDTAHTRSRSLAHTYTYARSRTPSLPYSLSPVRTQQSLMARLGGCFSWKCHISHKTESICKQHNCRMKSAGLGFSILRNFWWCIEEADALSFSAFFFFLNRDNSCTTWGILSFYKSPRCLIFKGKIFFLSLTAALELRICCYKTPAHA